VRLGTLREGPAHRTPSHCLGCSSEPPPRSPISPPLRTHYLCPPNTFAHPLPLPTQVPLVDESKYGGGLYVQAEADVASRRLVGLQRGEVLRLHTWHL
jgi:hypothetical protein